MATDYHSDKLRRLPLVPDSLLRRHHVYEPHDHRFKAAARVLQSLNREVLGLPIGVHVSSSGRARKLGSLLSLTAGKSGRNFLAPQVAELALRESVYREPGACFDEDRLFRNMLSSQPLAFNLFGPLRLDLALAGRVLRRLLPDFVDISVRGIWFEHSPGRGAATLTADYTAFDVLVRYVRPTGQVGFVAVELKYTEHCHDPAPPPRYRHTEIARSTGMFLDPDSPALRAAPFQQLFREHCLAVAMLARGDYDEGCLVFIAPELNHLAHNAARGYRCQLAEPSGTQPGFTLLTLEQVIQAIADEGEPTYAEELHRRYADFKWVEREVDSALAGASGPWLSGVQDKTAGPFGESPHASEH